MPAITESFGERRGFGAGIKVGEGELYLSVNAQFSLCLSTGPHCQVKIQSSQPLFLFVPGMAFFFAGCCVNVARDLVASRLAVVLVANSMAVGGAEPALDPLALDGCLELRDAAVKGFFLFGGDGVVGGAGAAVVLSSNGWKGGFNLREEFLDFAALACGGQSEMVDCPLDDIVTVCGCDRQVVEIGIAIVGQVRALGENAGFSVEWGRVGRGDDVVGKLGGGGRSERILSPRRRVSRSRFLWRGLKVSFQALQLWSTFGFLYYSGRLLGKELARRREEVANSASQLSVIGRPACWELFCASSTVMMNWVTQGSLVQ